MSPRNPQLSRVIVPALIGLLAAVCIVPIGYLVWKGSRDVGLLAKVIRSSGTWLAVGRSLLLAACAAFAALLLAVPVAWLTFVTDLPGRRFWRIVLVLPLAVPSYVGAFVVLLFFGPSGVWNIDPYGLFGAVLAISFTYPLALLALQAALARIDPRQWEAARTLGLSPWRAFARVVLPQLRPALAASALLVGLYAIGDFGAVSMLRYDSLSFLIYIRQKSLFDADEAVVLGLVLVALSTALVFVLVAVGGRVTRAVRSERGSWPTVRLGRWRWPALTLCSLIFAAGVVAPVGVVVAWLVRGLGLGHDLQFPAEAAWTSLWLGASAAFVVVVLAFGPTMAARLGYPGRSLVRATAYTAYAIPGIVVALALVSMGTGWLRAIYQTAPLLLLAYLIRFFPLAVTTIDDAVSAQTAGLVNAARSLGASPTRAFLRVVAPTATPAAAAAFVAVFIAVIKELPATLILRPADFRTLATDIWQLTEDAYFSAAAAPVLLMLGLATVGLLYLPQTRVGNRRAK